MTRIFTLFVIVALLASVAYLPVNAQQGRLGVKENAAHTSTLKAVSNQKPAEIAGAGRLQTHAAPPPRPRPQPRPQPQRPSSKKQDKKQQDKKQQDKKKKDKKKKDKKQKGKNNSQKNQQGKNQSGQKPLGKNPQPNNRAHGASQSAAQYRLSYIPQTKAEHQAMQMQRDEARNLIGQIRRAPPKSDKRKALRQQLDEKYGLAFARAPHWQAEHLVRRGEIIALDMSPAARAAAEELGFRQVRQSVLPSAGIDMVVLEAPGGVSLEEALTQIRSADKTGRYELNAAFSPSGDESGAAAALRGRLPKYGNQAFSIGMIDTGVQESNASLMGTLIQQQNFGRGNVITERDHGTAIASLLAQHGDADIRIADVFSGAAAFSDAEAIVRALDWLASENVGVINMSLTGPESFILERVTESLIARGFLIVAAVGNEGPEGAAQYPASYADVIGVTAVDEAGQVFEHANQGMSVDFSALGVDVSAASLEGAKPYSGTSFAVPVVSAYLALKLQQPDTARARRALDELKAASQDLGQPGIDPVFGAGVLKLGNP